MTTLNVPNNLTNGTTADATDVQQNFDAVESHVNTELVNRDGSIAMTGELLLPSNPTSNLGAATKSYVDTQVGNEESARITAVSSEATTRASADTALDNRVTALEGTDIAVTLTGNVTGSGTITNLGNVSIATTVDAEVVQDIVGAMVSGNTESGISVTYDDTGNSLDFNVNDPTISLTGDVTGSATMTNLGNVSIATTVGHNYVAYTPVLTASTTNPTLGTGGVATGSYCVIGDMVHYIAYIKFGTSGWSAGSGEYYVSLPVSASTSGASQYNLGTGYYYDGGHWHILIATRETATTCAMASATAAPYSDELSHSEPLGKHAGDIISLNLMYRKA